MAQEISALNAKLKACITDFTEGKLELAEFREKAMDLIQQGAYFGTTSNTTPHHTLLHCLVLSNQHRENDAAIKELVQVSSNAFSIHDGSGRTPIETLLLTSPDTPIDEIKHLITIGNALHCKNFQHETLLHTACSMGNLELVQYLASEGLDVAATTNRRRTALHCSAYGNNPALCLWLVEQGLDLAAIDSDNNTVYSLATGESATKITNWLVQNLFNTIGSLKNYGNNLKKQGAPKGEVAIELATKLEEKAGAFFKPGGVTEDELKQFKTEFNELLHSKDTEMSEYRTSWSTIIANIAIALTGLGVFAILGRLAYTAYTQNRALFFLQSPQTSGEVKINAVDSALSSLK